MGVGVGDGRRMGMSLWLRMTRPKHTFASARWSAGSAGTKCRPGPPGSPNSTLGYPIVNAITIPKKLGSLSVSMGVPPK